MAIPRKQIGWSQESNLLWEISRQMEKLTGVAFNSGGGGGGGVQSVTGLNTDNTDPLNPVVEIAVDNTTIQGAGTSGIPLRATGNMYTQCIDLSVNTFTIVEPGVYRIVNSGGGYNIVFNVNPADYPGNKVVLINTDTNYAAPIYTDDSYLLNYQGTNKSLNKINAGATFEFFSVYEPTCGDYSWRTNATTSVTARENILLLDGLDPINLFPAIDGGGFYVITVANNALDSGGQIFFPSAAAYIGQRIVILNLDALYNAVIVNDGNAPIDLDASTLNYIAPTTSYEFISTGNYWYILSTRTV